MLLRRLRGSAVTACVLIGWRAGSAAAVAARGSAASPSFRAAAGGCRAGGGAGKPSVASAAFAFAKSSAGGGGTSIGVGRRVPLRRRSRRDRSGSGSSGLGDARQRVDLAQRGRDRLHHRVERRMLRVDLLEGVERAADGHEHLVAPFEILALRTLDAMKGAHRFGDRIGDRPSAVRGPLRPTGERSTRKQGVLERSWRVGWDPTSVLQAGTGPTRRHSLTTLEGKVAEAKASSSEQVEEGRRVGRPTVDFPSRRTTAPSAVRTIGPGPRRGRALAGRRGREETARRPRRG